jgi:hypothetical protein
MRLLADDSDQPQVWFPAAGASMMAEFTQPTTYPISVSCPGGMARQFRVQIASAETPELWKLAGSFRDFISAERCAAQLIDAGEHTRVIACTALPTAA